MVANDFGRFIAAARNHAGMSQTELAKTLGVNSQQVSRWERGATLPKTRLLPKLRELLGLDNSEMYELYSVAGENHVRDARRQAAANRAEAAAIRADYEATLAEMREIVEANRAINAEILGHITDLRDELLELRRSAGDSDSESSGEPQRRASGTPG